MGHLVVWDRPQQPLKFLKIPLASECQTLYVSIMDYTVTPEAVLSLRFAHMNKFLKKLQTPNSKAFIRQLWLNR